MTNSQSKVSEAIKKAVVALQGYKCNNEPGKNLYRLIDVKCPRWETHGGNFSQGGYQVDHNIERSIGGSDDIENLQALCLDCHAVKTNNFMRLPKDEKKKLKEKNKDNALEKEIKSKALDEKKLKEKLEKEKKVEKEIKEKLEKKIEKELKEKFEKEKEGELKELKEKFEKEKEKEIEKKVDEKVKKELKKKVEKEREDEKNRLKIYEKDKNKFKYNCAPCMYFTDRIDTMGRHIKSVKHEKKIKQIEQGIEPAYTCKGCSKEYNNKTGYYLHIKTCTPYKNLKNSLEVLTTGKIFLNMKMR
ncbi:MAG: hypothetical protein Edafosvirus46_5 [Edafosvirus sp.]|uniref:HNH nuclease domain-containing protein n=1 Tax=Edafosvirus sp. TaxID=2487765 RepID=A0A3G4ZZA0_9VIRU|nr:MAG: hypothetical protein Edafosvirus46_5 [Edafosvirus sp.]